MTAHLVECCGCNGAGEVVDGHPHDPYAESFKCALCDGTGTIPHDEPFCDACFVANEMTILEDVGQ